ncbi:hypothetical protein GE21DRAFT_1233110 [Neurospora crassa]|nr:hypothetical protein B7J19.30 [imported] - Neurospora crassa [Neurospora crassa]KHE85241.1 hypothetical protein GE21DRAFT_1233110 [Neurospora crassa]
MTWASVSQCPAVTYGRVAGTIERNPSNNRAGAFSYVYVTLRCTCHANLVGQLSKTLISLTSFDFPSTVSTSILSPKPWYSSPSQWLSDDIHLILICCCVIEPQTILWHRLYGWMWLVLLGVAIRPDRYPRQALQVSSRLPSSRSFLISRHRPDYKFSELF